MCSVIYPNEGTTYFGLVILRHSCVIFDSCQVT